MYINDVFIIHIFFTSFFAYFLKHFLVTTFKGPDGNEVESISSFGPTTAPVANSVSVYFIVYIYIKLITTLVK